MQSSKLPWTDELREYIERPWSKLVENANGEVASDVLATFTPPGNVQAPEDSDKCKSDVDRHIGWLKPHDGLGSTCPKKLTEAEKAQLLAE
jgi:hypothetical protein